MKIKQYVEMMLWWYFSWMGEILSIEHKLQGLIENYEYENESFKKF